MEAKYIDLHTHTVYSDGQLTPEQMVRFSAINGIDILAITDHDQTRGYFEAKSTAKKYGITLIAGAEITTPKYHLLALNFNPNNTKLQKFLEYSRDLQKYNCERRVNILRQGGIPISMRKIEKEFPHSRLGKGNIKEILCQDKKCREYLKEKHSTFSSLEIFKHYLGKNGIANNIEPRMGVDIQTAINIVHEAGGIIGIAHPHKNIEKMEELETLIKQGIDFLEIQPNFRHQYKQFEDFAQENNLPMSYGSDYHGPTMSRPLLTRGENVLSKGLASILNITQ